MQRDNIGWLNGSCQECSRHSSKCEGNDLLMCGRECSGLAYACM